MTKILAISDVHGEENENLYTYLNNNDIDLVLILGDITDFGPLEFVSTFINKVADCGVDVIAIPGNCDPKGICNAINEVSFCLHNNIIAYGDAILFGFGGSIQLHSILIVKWMMTRFMRKFMICWLIMTTYTILMFLK